MKRSFLVHSTLYAGSAALLRLGGFVTFTWLAHALSVEGFATFGLLYALQTGVATFASAGVLEGLIARLRGVEGPKREVLFSTANAQFLVVLAATTAVSCGISVLLSTRLGLMSVTGALVSGALLSFAMLQAQLVRLNERHLQSLHFGFTVPAMGMLTAACAFLLIESLDAFFLGSAAGLALGMLFSWSGVMRTCWTDLWLGLKLNAPFVVIAVFGWLSGYGNNFIIELQLDPKDVARFTFALMLSSVLQLVATALNQVWSPRFFRLYSTVPREAMESENRKVYAIQAIVLGAVGAAILVAFPFALGLLGGGAVAYRDMKVEMLFMSAAYVLLVPWWHCNNYFLIEGRGAELLRIVIATSALGLVVWVVLMWVLGSIGVYLGFFLQMALRAVAIAWVAGRTWRLRVPWDGVAAGIALVGLGYFVAAMN